MILGVNDALISSNSIELAVYPLNFDAIPFYQGEISRDHGDRRVLSADALKRLYFEHKGVRDPVVVLQRRWFWCGAIAMPGLTAVDPIAGAARRQGTLRRPQRRMSGACRHQHPKVIFPPIGRD